MGKYSTLNRSVGGTFGGYASAHRIIFPPKRNLDCPQSIAAVSTVGAWLSTSVLDGGEAGGSTDAKAVIVMKPFSSTVGRLYHWWKRQVPRARMVKEMRAMKAPPRMGRAVELTKLTMVDRKKTGVWIIMHSLG